MSRCEAHLEQQLASIPDSPTDTLINGTISCREWGCGVNVLDVNYFCWFSLWLHLKLSPT
jgi:hypothetical protein